MWDFSDKGQQREIILKKGKKKGKIFENLDKNVQNVKILWKGAGVIIASNRMLVLE